MDSQNFESYLPIYDAVPKDWEDGRAFFVEQLKKISQAVNIREIGWYLDEELLTGGQFVPAKPAPGTLPLTSPLPYRSIFRIVVDFSPLTNNIANTKPHNVIVDANFTLIDLWAAATDPVSLTGNPIPNGTETISYDANNIIITTTVPRSPNNRCYAVMEYMQEL